MSENGYAIEVKDVSKSFSSRQHKTLKDLVTNIGSKKPEAKRVLKNVSFTVKNGSSLGIIGTNGTGKSTLMKIIAGIMEPDTGEVCVKGKVASLLELGIGFHQDLSGRENIYIKGSSFGFSKKEIEKRMDKIISFSELEDDIDEPIRTYSSGMSARLAFAISINVDADIILADEIFSVGDLSFKEKCTNVFRKMRKNGMTIVIVSHGIGTIRDMCNDAIWLRDGEIFDSGNCKRVCDHYESEEGESFKATLRSANEGNDQAQNRLALMYRDGKGVETDHLNAIYWFKQSAEQKNAEAQRNLADMISKGIGIEQSQEEALRWFLLSADSGDAVAMMRVANAYKDGIGVEVNHTEAIRWFRELSEMGNSRAQFILAEMLMNRNSICEDSNEALEWFNKSAESGNSSARYRIGVIYRDGVGVDKDIKQAFKWFNLAASQGNMEAQIALMDILSSNVDQLRDIGVEEELNLALEQLKQLAETGSTIAQKNLAGKLLSGVGTEQDAIVALTWYLKAANAGDPGARHQVGLMYKNGIGTERDIAEAVRWFKLAMEQKNIGAITEFAWMLMNGDGMDEDKRAAFKLFKEIADLGIASIRNQVGIMYRDGIGTEKNKENAKIYFDLSAEQGNLLARMNLADILSKSNDPRDIENVLKIYLTMSDIGNALASYKLGIMYRDGVGIEKNIDLARYWLSVAAKRNNKDAQQELGKM